VTYVAGSILTDTKKLLGIEEDYAAFDLDVLTHINSVLSTLSQLGIGPAGGFAIEDATATWEDFAGTDKELSSIKTYVYLRVRMFFDPPTTSYLISAYEKQIEELEWRLNVKREETAWVPPTPTPPVEPEVIVIPSSQAWYSE
jgi:hypothetical protein